MPNWIVEHSVKVAIGFLIPALLGGIGYIAWYVAMVPQIEQSLARHEDKLATISTNLILLFGQGDKPLDESFVKKLISSVKDLGNAKARFIDKASVTSGTVMG